MSGSFLELQVAGFQLPSTPYARLLSEMPAVAANRGAIVRSDDSPAGGLLISTGSSWIPYATADALAALAAAVPSPASSAPPSVADSSAKGTMLRYALENHTHASKARKKTATTDSNGLYTWIFDTPFTVGVRPIIVGMAQVAQGVTEVYNVQEDGVPTHALARVRVGRPVGAVVSILGISVISAPAPVGVVTVDLVALEP